MVQRGTLSNAYLASVSVGSLLRHPRLRREP